MRRQWEPLLNRRGAGNCRGARLAIVDVAAMGGRALVGGTEKTPSPGAVFYATVMGTAPESSWCGDAAGRGSRSLMWRQWADVLWFGGRSKLHPRALFYAAAMAAYFVRGSFRVFSSFTPGLIPFTQP